MAQISASAAHVTGCHVTRGCNSLRPLAGNGRDRERPRSSCSLQPVCGTRSSRHPESWPSPASRSLRRDGGGPSPRRASAAFSQPQHHRGPLTCRWDQLAFAKLPGVRVHAAGIGGAGNRGRGSGAPGAGEQATSSACRLLLLCSPPGRRRQHLAPCHWLPGRGDGRAPGRGGGGRRQRSASALREFGAVRMGFREEDRGLPDSCGLPLSWGPGFKMGPNWQRFAPLLSPFCSCGHPPTFSYHFPFTAPSPQWSLFGLLRHRWKDNRGQQRCATSRCLVSARQSTGEMNVAAVGGLFASTIWGIKAMLEDCFWLWAWKV